MKLQVTKPNNKMKTALIILLSILMASCHYNKLGEQGFTHNATINKGEQGDGFQGVHFWRGDVLKMKITLDSSAWFKTSAKFYGDGVPIFKTGGFGEFNFIGYHRKNGAVVGWNPSTKRNHFWIGSYVHPGSKIPVFKYAIEVSANKQFEVMIRKSSSDKKYYFLFSYDGKTVNIDEKMGAEFICYLTYFYLGGEGESAIYAPQSLKSTIIYEESL